MREFGRMIAPETIRFERVLPGPIERVWAFLTESDKRAKWLAAGPMELRPGGKVELRFFHANLSSRSEPVPERFRKFEKGAVNRGTVTRCEPPHLLSFTWGEGDGEPSEVTFELTPRENDVLLVLTHARLVRPDGRLSVASGWHAHVDLLIDQLEGRESGGFWSAFESAEAEYRQRLGTG
jgi:uncharacterized protein YndB with AHSA1/START domain